MGRLPHQEDAVQDPVCICVTTVYLRELSMNKGQYGPYRAAVRVLEIMDEERYLVLDAFILRV